MEFTAKDLRYKTKQVLTSILQGKAPLITYRGKVVARMVSVSKQERKNFKPIAFGLWQDRKDLEDVHQWLDKIRSPRYSR